MSIDGQADILSELGSQHRDRAARRLQRQQADLTQLPEDMWRQNQTPRKDGDYWYTVLPCVGCGLPASRYGLHIDHGVQWDKKTGEQVLPGGPGLSDQGVCMLMAMGRDHAVEADHIMSVSQEDPNRPVYPPPAEWWGRCYAHEHKKPRCKDVCWEAHHRHLTRMADLVWGGDGWRQP
jgi:hypothetical protein